MTTSQINQLAMFKAVHQFCLTRSDLIEDVPPFVSGINTLGQHIAAISGMESLLSLRPGETARDKNNIRLALCRITSSAVSACRSFAENGHDSALQNDLSISLADLKKISSEELPDIARNLFNRIHPLAPQLAVYGLTNGIFSAWNHILNTYAPNFKSPRAAMLQRKNLNQCFIQLFKDGNILCSDFIDPLADTFKEKDPEFLKNYLLSRSFTNIGIKGGMIKGTIRSNEQGNPIQGASVTLVGFGVVVKSDEEGHFLFKAVKKGTHMIRAEKADYFTKTSHSFELKEGGLANIDFELNRAEILQY